jgi:hypothetical protein
MAVLVTGGHGFLAQIMLGELVNSWWLFLCNDQVRIHHVLPPVVGDTIDPP